MDNQYDLFLLLLVIVVWAAFVLPDYALVQHLRSTIDTKTREKQLHHFARQTWEAKFLVWAAIAGGVGGALTKETLTLTSFLILIIVALLGVLLIGFGSMIIASRAGYGSDISDHPSRAVFFSALGLAVFTFSCGFVKLAKGEADLPGWADFLSPVFAGIATVVGIIGGVLSIIRQLRKT